MSIQQIIHVSTAGGEAHPLLALLLVPVQIIGLGCHSFPNPHPYSHADTNHGTAASISQAGKRGLSFSLSYLPF